MLGHVERKFLQVVTPVIDQLSQIPRPRAIKWEWSVFLFSSATVQ